MRAYLGLSSAPAKVQNISADRVTLLTTHPQRPGLTTLVELVSEGRSFKNILSLLVTGVEPHPDGGYTVDGEFTRPLTDDELKDLSA